jgi:RNA polymerase sigma-70 factor, ECF subfamily
VSAPILGRVIGDGFEVELAAAQRGHEAAFARLWRDANPPLLRYLRVIAPDLAEDVAAETWLRVLRGLKGFRGDEQAWRAWVFTICRHLVIDERRRAKAPTIALSEVPAARLTTGSDAADEAIEHFSTKAALEMVARLPPLQAEVILLRVLAGLETDAVAKLVGRSPGAVRVAAHRGLRRLAEIAAQAGVTL